MKQKSLYITKSIINQLYLKQQLYTLDMKEETSIMEYLNVFNEIIYELASKDVKLEDENNTLIFFTLLPLSFEYLDIILLYKNDTIELKEKLSSASRHFKVLLAKDVLDLNAYKYIIKRRIFKVLKGVLLLMKDEKSENLYELLQDIVTSGVTMIIENKVIDMT
uniref:Reverse transcriptase Ty1/copia-type domain-containing protein n=1 Tax=Physcomitrium patens TaxID=3218 RepID=A0A2K1IV75_PHYPA|nr:hypothetical protein PHYPA_025111 [Physcomitrium patens]